MNQARQSPLFIFLIACCVLLVSPACKKKVKCDNVQCLNGGNCADGECQCINGFTGIKCEIAPPDPCASVSCQNGGTCMDGTCDCTSGYEGNNCQSEMRTKFLIINAGVSSTCSGPNLFGNSVDIVPGANIDEIKIKVYVTNSYCNDGYYYVNANVTSTNTITIPPQTLCEGTNGGISLSANEGTLTDNQLTIVYHSSYYHEVGGTNYDCTAIIQL